jgi:uncharacterized phage protein gp47/JayE
MATTYGLTSTGFVYPSLQDIVSQLETETQATFGANIDVSSTSVAGQFIGNLANKFTQLWELLAAVYASVDPDTATGIALDGCCARVGVYRLAATSTIVYEFLYGAQGTVIPVNHLIAQSNGTQFALESATTIGGSTWGDVSIEYTGSIVPANQYSFIINSHTYTYTATSGDTILSMLTGLAALIQAGETDVTASASTVNTVPSMRLLSTDGIISFTLGTFYTGFAINTNIAYASIGEYAASVTGPTAAPSGSVTTIFQPVTGLSEITNIASGETGTNIESDDALRVRRRKALAGSAYATNEALQTRLLQEVSGVSYCQVISNRTSGVVNGQPANSFWVIIEGGDPTAIAEKIWQLMPAGIPSYGGTSVTIYDSNGDAQVINFDRPTNVYIWVNGTVSAYTSSFPADSVSIIAQNIVTFGQENYSVGDSVIWQALYAPIYQCPGILTVAFTIGYSSSATVPPVSYSDTNITITGAQLAQFAAAQIVFTVS